MGRLTLKEAESRAKEKEEEDNPFDSNWDRNLTKNLSNCYVISITEFWVDSLERGEWEMKRMAEGLPTERLHNPSLLDGSHEPIAFFVFGSKRLMDIFYFYLTSSEGMKYLRGIYLGSENYYQLFVRYYDSKGRPHTRQDLTISFSQTGELIDVSKNKL